MSGEWEKNEFKQKVDFFEYSFFVREGVFKPRPETEILVEVFLDYFREFIYSEASIKRARKRKIVVVDVGTGTGCIIISIERFMRKYKKAFDLDIVFVGTDISRNIGKLFRANADLNFSDAKFILCDKLSAVKEADFVVSNPPYVSLAVQKLIDDVDDPPESIFGGEKGYEFTLELIKDAAKVLKIGGFLFLETGYDDLKFFNMYELRQEYKEKIFETAEKEGFKVYPPVKDYRKIERILILKKIF